MLTNLLSGPDMMVVLVIVMLVFGPKNLPKLARSIGSSVKELKKGLNGEVENETASSATPAAPAAKPVPPGDSKTSDHR